MATHKSVCLEMPHGKRKDQGLHSLYVPVVELTLLQTPHLWGVEIAGPTASLRWQRLALLFLYSAPSPRKQRTLSAYPLEIH